MTGSFCRSVRPMVVQKFYCMNLLLRLKLVGTLFLCCLHPCFSQQSSIVVWNTQVERISPHEGRLTITAQILPEWHLYSQHLKDGGPQPTRFEFAQNSSYQLSRFDEKGKPYTYHDDVFEMDITWYSEQVNFIANLKITEPVLVLKGTIEYMICNKETCVPEKKELVIPIDLTKPTR